MNSDGQFVGLLHAGRPKNTDNRRVFFTPAEVLFADIHAKIKHRVVWAEPTLPVIGQISAVAKEPVVAESSKASGDKAQPQSQVQKQRQARAKAQPTAQQKVKQKARK